MKKTLKKPHLGQNFLHSEPVRRDIVNAAELTNEDIVLEIGPGKGFLTEILLSLAKKVIAVEKDRVLVKELKERFSSEIESKKLVLVEEDIRNFSPSSLKLKVGEYKLVANIPYYITGEIIRSFLDTKCHPSKMVLMVQKEVAQRISARDGKESILSIAVKAYGKPSIVRIVGRGSFTPVPKVDSAVIKIDNISKDFFKNFSEKEFFDMIHAGFAHKRKKLNSNLMEISSGKKVTDAFKKVELPENMRAEDLGLIQWQDLAKILAK